ncbi:CLK4-associating serine/arginine rich protein isoform X2 [Culicoides brevitarsis]|uniref:CLK4-associating serine/arginine rich protein isoform X2 n=1 Tax=Culicoides brevitarsis TaxID=469753 RepID=UPI00307BB29F
MYHEAKKFEKKARAHLDYIPQVKTEKSEDEEMCIEERQLNYERYRIITLNDFLGFKETEFLAQLDELYDINAMQNDARAKKKKQNSKTGISIGYTYDTEDYATQTFTQSIASMEGKSSNSRYDELAKDSSDSDMDFDLPIDINKISTSNANELNATGRRYGMLSNDFFSFITNDFDELQALRESQKEDCGKSNRTGRRERRERREKKMRPINSSIPSYAKTESDQMDTFKQEEESSDSNTDVPEKITYITSFGNDEPKMEKKPLYSDKLKENLDKFKQTSRRKKYSRRYSSSSSSSSSTSSSSSSSSSSSDYRRRKTKRTKTKEPQNSQRENCSPPKNQTLDIPIKRYYGRNKNSSDSDLSYDSSSNQRDDKSNENHKGNAQSRGGKSTMNVKGSYESTGETKINQKERLKRKMQHLLNKQYKEDKKLETLKKLQQIEEQKEREVEMKELALKMRKRQRELRHQYSSSDDAHVRKSHSSDRSQSKHRRSRSSSKSSQSSRSNYSRRSSHYSNKYDRRSRYRRSSKDRHSSDRYRRDRSRYRSRSSDRYSNSRSRK